MTRSSDGVSKFEVPQHVNSERDEDSISGILRFHVVKDAPMDLVRKTKAYRAAYITGVQLIRLKRRKQKQVVALARRLAAVLHARASVLLKKVRSLVNITKREITAPVREGFVWTLETQEGLSKARSEGKALRFLLSMSKDGAQDTLKKLWAMRNYIMPACAFVFFAMTVTFVNSLTVALSVEYSGQYIGYVRSEADFDAAEKQMMNRIVYEEYVHPEDAIPKYTLKIVSEDEIISQDKLTDMIIQASGNELSEGYGLYVNARFVGAMEDSAPLNRMLNSIINEYRTGDPGETVEFVKDVEVKEGLFPVSSIVDLSVMEDKMDQNETERRTYTVQSGDAPTLIAQKYNMAYSDLKRLNPNIETKLLVGQEVLIQQSVPLLGVKVTRTEVYNEEVPFKIEHIQDKTQYQGYTKVQQMGQKGINEITANVTYVDGLETQRTVVETKVLKAPVNEQMIVGGLQPLQQLPASAMSTSSNFIWPVDGGYMSCGFYGYYNHGGIDIATKAGTAVRASAAGTVELARYYTGNAYGKYVIINHGGGVKTLYAHNSEVYVEVGQWVEQGQLIAAIGRTGNATGNHCHFEIIIGGVRRNPANYIGTSYNR